MTEHSYHVYAPVDPTTGRRLCYCEQERRGIPNSDSPSVPGVTPVDKASESWEALALQGAFDG